MSQVGDLEGFESLHRDLLALSESRLSNIDRLWVQLEARITDFRRLLDKNARSEQSRKALASGRLHVQDDEYAINEEFQQNALQVADALDLDELESARLLLAAQDDAVALGRSAMESSIIRFHQTRKYLLDCLRLVLQTSEDMDAEQQIREAFDDVVGRIVQAQERGGQGQKFVPRCLQHMNQIKAQLQDLVDKLNGASVLGQVQRPDILDTIEFQRVSLVQQHESLGTIVHFLIKKNHSTSADFEQVLDTLRRFDKYDNLLVHYFPAVAAFIALFGAPEGVSSLEEARSLNEKVIGNKDQNPWTLHYVHAAVSVWWLAEYSGWYMDNPPASPLAGVNLDEENKSRVRQFTEALKDGAFDFLLSMSADVKPIEWLDPARHGLRQWLQRKSPPLLPDTVTFSNYLQLLLMEQLETFIDAFITHMPDVLRKLRIDEDEQRQLSLTHEHDLDLERFLVIISFAFEGRPDAAQAFWTDPDSNLAGFLHWASRRTTTPLLSAFCEMLQSLAEDEICASKAHEFLLGERTSSSSGKMIRSHSLTWDKIFRELTFYSSNVRERPVMPQSSFFRGKQSHEQAEAEPESAMMLESYLRLMTRLCTESAAARSFLLEHATFSIIDMLYQLASSENVSTRLRACVFTTLRSLLSHKTKERSDFIWKSLDAWVSGDSVATSLVPRNPLAGVAPSSVMDGMLHRLGAGYEECNAFIQLLQTLVAPSEDDAGSDDSLPFPESLGSSNRMPGIDPYVDFVGQVFRARPAEINDPVQFRLLCLTCLEFFNTCLATFNEDLVIFANQSNVAIDRAIGASDLASYVRLHPFARVMEWVFNDGVMSALFSALHQDVAELGNASSDSPLVLSLLRAIQVVNLVMDLQATYMDVVRPLIKLQPTHRRNPVANAAYATFEDGVLNNLSVIADLGLYCGSGHSALIIASLKLLETLSASSKLVGGITPILGRYSGRNKAIAALEANNDAERISRCLVNEISTNLELDEGPGSDAYLIKMHILDFILACLEAMPDIPSIAHLLLGFRCGTDAIDISTEGSFAEGNSLFHGILAIAADYPLRDQACGILSWAVALKYKAVQIMKALWRSPLSSELVMSELRNSDFITGLLSKEVVVNPSTMWDGRILDDSVFLLSSSSYALFDFVRHRASTLQYTALEFRRLTQGTSSTLRERILAAVEGHSSNLDGQQLEMPSIFDLFDFMELETQTYAMAPELFYFKDLDLSVCLEDSRSEPVTYNPRKVRELLALRCNEVRKSGYLTTPKEKLACDQEADEILRFIEIENQNGRLAAARLAALESWTHVMLMIIRTGVLEGSRRTSFVVQTVQTILPKFEKCSVEKLEEAKPLADLAKHLLFSLSFDAQSFQKGEISETASDRLFQLFRVCLRAVYSPIADSQLKETLYGICYRYLTGMSDAFETSSVLRKHSTSTIRSAGERFMDVICDDAYVGDRTCRISALLLLGSLVTLGIHENSNYVLEAFVRLNITGLMVDSIKNIVSELQVCEKDDVELQVSYYKAKFALLLKISQTRFGAHAIFDAGLFQAIRASGLFTIDPDLGADMNINGSMEVYFQLLLGLMRIINSVVLSRGEQNEQTLAQGRKFLSENRLSVLSVFKRATSIGSINRVVSAEVVEDLADCYMLLITLTGFIDLDDQNGSKPSTGFT